MTYFTPQQIADMKLKAVYDQQAQRESQVEHETKSLAWLEAKTKPKPTVKRPALASSSALVQSFIARGLIVPPKPKQPVAKRTFVKVAGSKHPELIGMDRSKYQAAWMKKKRDATKPRWKAFHKMTEKEKDAYRSARNARLLTSPYRENRLAYFRKRWRAMSPEAKKLHYLKKNTIYNYRLTKEKRDEWRKKLSCGLCEHL